MESIYPNTCAMQSMPVSGSGSFEKMYVAPVFSNFGHPFYIALNYWMIVCNELEWVWKEVVMAWF
jgi:hypothetical protein